MLEPMIRRDFFHLVSGLATTSVLGACATRGALRTRPVDTPSAAARAPIGAICFDLFTLFDPRSVIATAASVVGERAEELCESWRSRQFQYAFLRASGERYVDFRAVTEAALTFAAKAMNITISAADRARLVAAYSRLEPWPDTRAQLGRFREAGLRLAPLANYAPAMIEALLANADLTGFFEAQISTDQAQTYKPDPRAYALGVSTLRMPRQRIAFAAFGGWDAAGAKWFGYPTFWVNRLGVPLEELAPPPDGTGPTLAELALFVSKWA